SEPPTDGAPHHNLPSELSSFIGREQAGRPAFASLAEAIDSRRLLLALDNCEHVVQACAELVDWLLRQCRGMRVLATSREPLGVPGEVAWAVPSLSVPSAGVVPAAEHTRFDARPVVRGARGGIAPDVQRK